MILYHYPISPFSEKIRAMAGYCGKTWYSYEVASSPPRRLLDTFIGGYRKIPVAQQGADFFCDSHLIASRFFAELGADNVQISQSLTDKFERDIFSSCIVAIPSQKLLSFWFRSFKLSEFMRTLIDRTQVAAKTNGFDESIKQAKENWRYHYECLNNLLENNKFILGDKPCDVDFSAYHLIWFYQKVLNMEVGQPYSEISRWFNRIEQFGHGTVLKADNDFVINQVKSNPPLPIVKEAQSHSDINKTVRIQPDDYIVDGTEGILVGATDDSWTIKKSHIEFGDIHIHFPKKGYVLTLI